MGDESGQATVWRAQYVNDPQMPPVAIKCMKPHPSRDYASRFLEEVHSLRELEEHPHIMWMYDWIEAEGGLRYLVMPVMGESLRAVLDRRGQLTPAEAIRYLQQIADALDFAHQHGIIHRDLKPGNVLVADEGGKAVPKVIDFGIAKVSGPSGNTSKLTMAGAVFGTPHYMSPEQAAGEAVDHRTDIYSLGVMLYEMLSGEMPFKAENFMGILTMHMYKAPPPILALVPQPEIPPGLDAIVLKCLSKKPENRYASMEALVEDLEKELGERSIALHIEDEDLVDLKTVRDAVDFVYGRVSGG